MINETKLLASAQKGDTAAFQQIVEQYQTLICSITLNGTGRIDISEDLAQETFLNAWKNLSQLTDLCGFRAWLCTIARNTINNYHRRKKTVSLDTANPTEIASEDQTPQDILITQEENMMLEQALMQIPVEYRQPFIMYYRNNQSIRQVAEELDLNESTVRTRLQRARQMLRENIAEKLERIIANTTPKKAFTTVVMAGITGAALTTAATATASAASTAASSGIGALFSTAAAKIVTAAVVLAVGVGGAIAYNNSKSANNSQTPISTAQSSITQPVSQPLQNPTTTLSQNNTPANTTSDTSPQPQPTNTENTQPIAIASSQPKSDTPVEPADTQPAESDNQPKKLFISIKGTVIDKTTSKPIQNALSYLPPQSQQPPTKTDSEGKFFQNFDVTNIPGIEEMPANTDFPIRIIAAGYTTRSVSVHVSLNTISDAGTIELTPSTKVAGTVLDQTGNPIENAEVSTFHFTNMPMKTDKEGHFEIDGLDPAFQTYSLQAKHPDYPASVIRFSPLKAGETIYKDIVMTKGVTVHGTITNVNGNPIPNVDIGNTTSRLMWNVIKAKTDAQGKYTLNNVPPGDLTIWAINKHYAPYVNKLVLENNITDKVLDITMPTPVELNGQVVDTAGNPVHGAVVVIYEYQDVMNIGENRIMTDSQGMFTLPNAPAEGKMKIEVFGNNITNATPMLDMGEDFYTIEVKRSGKIYGKVIDSQTQQPVSNFLVKMIFSKAGTSLGGYAVSWNREGHTFSSDEGFFDTGDEDIPIGSDYNITIFADGYEPLMIDPVTVQPISDNPERTEFALLPASVIEGLVADVNDIPIAEVRLRWITISTDYRHWEDRLTTITDKDGHFNLTAGGNSARALYITAKEYSPLLFRADNLPYNEEGKLSFTLEKAPILYGFVKDQNDQPVINTKVKAQTMETQAEQFTDINIWNLSSFETTTDRDGYYEIFDLPAGEVTLTIYNADSYQTIAEPQKITLTSGQMLQMDISAEIEE